MKIAELLERREYYICSNCRMRQKNLTNECEFCGAQFTNFDSVLYKIFKIKENLNEI